MQLKGSQGEAMVFRLTIESVEAEETRSDQGGGSECGPADPHHFGMNLDTEELT